MTIDYGYTLDTDSAKNAESIGKFIRETGKYKGKFTRAELLISQAKGSRGIEFDFVSDDGKECTVQVWTHNGQNEPLPGINMINALLACLSLRGIKPQRMTVEKYDYDNKRREKFDVDAFPDLMGKPIGLLLQKEISHYNSKDKTKMLIYAAFNHASEKTATEILDRVAQPVALSRLVSVLADKDRRDKGQKASVGSGSYHQTAPAPAHELDDDLPF